MYVCTSIMSTEMATALSLDWWEAPESCDSFLEFICAHPGTLPDPSASSSSTPDKPTAARFQEIFCDYLAMQCAQDSHARHCLDERFDSSLSSDEKEFKRAVLELIETQPPSGPRKKLVELLKGHMGYGGLDDRRKRVLEQIKATRMSEDQPMFVEEEKEEDDDDDHDHDDASLHPLLKKLRYNEKLKRRLAFEPAKDSDGNGDPFWSEILRTSFSDNQTDEFTQYLRENDRARQFFERTYLRPRGHVFCINGSVCDLQCDAFLCPAAISGRNDTLTGSIFGRWRHLLPTKLREHLLSSSSSRPEFTLKRYGNFTRVASFRDWPWEALLQRRDLAHCPFFIAGQVQQQPGQIAPEPHMEALLETVRQFVAVALEEIRRAPPFARRERYLLALPVLGTGGGRAGDLTGILVERLLLILNELVTQQETDVDCVLVCADEPTFMLAQNIRLKLRRRHNKCKNLFPCFDLLQPRMRSSAARLAGFASDGHLSLFLGAGVSMGSGLPGWFDLLLAIEDQFTVSGEVVDRRIGDECNWDPLGMAEKLVKISSAQLDRDGKSISFKERVCELIDTQSQYPGLLLMLLASLPCKSIVTQNYDQLIEQAYSLRGMAEKAKESFSVIPNFPVKRADRWILKMHGCVSLPKEIVITKQDYVDYQSGRMKALAGLVQANLMTSHFMFVGFSLTDPNYLRIVKEVQHAIDPEVA